MTTPAYNSVTATIEGRTGYPQLKVGSSITDTISFYGVTPVVQPSGAAQTAVATTGAVTTGFGYSTTAQANAIVTLVNAIRSALVLEGLIAGA